MERKKREKKRKKGNEKVKKDSFHQKIEKIFVFMRVKIK